MKLLKHLAGKINYIPTGKDDDRMFNRRLLAFYGLAFSVYWSHLILILWFFLMVIKREADATVVIAFIGVPGALAGLGFWKYLKAAEKDDAKQSKDNSISG